MNKVQKPRRALLAATGALPLAMVLPRAARAQTGPMRILVGFPPGGGTDVVARLLADKMKDLLGTTVIVENRPGVGGMLATQQLKAAPPNGQTVMLTIDHSHVVVPLTFKDPGYHPTRDFTPLAGVASYYNALAVSTTIGVGSLREFGAWLKANPSKANIGVPAVGSVPHFAAQIVGKALGVEVVVVPYKGGAPLTQDLLGGQVPAGISSLTEQLDYHRAGRIKTLAVSGTARAKSAPDVPTFQELGLRGVDKNPWLAFFGPPGLPAEFVDRFTKAVATVLRMPEVSERLASVGNETAYATPAELREWVSSATAHWGPVIKESGYVPQ